MWAFGARDPGSNPGGAITPDLIVMLSVLRLNHRRKRDARLTTHCCLVARAFGCNEIIYTGDEDKKLENTINDITGRWGGRFFIRYEKNYRKILKEFNRKNFLICHLTMYGIPVQNKIRRIRKHKKILIVIGGEKVRGDVYQMADMNVSVTNQPHSEVAAMSIFLHEYFQSKELNKKFSKAEMKIVPQERGKKILNN